MKINGLESLLLSVKLAQLVLLKKISLEFIQYAETLEIKVTDKNNKPIFGTTKTKFIPI